MEKIYCTYSNNEDVIDYQVRLPDEYCLNTSNKYPLVVFLHGSGRRSSDITALDNYGFNYYEEMINEYNLIVVTPQCGVNHTWFDRLNILYHLIEHLKETYSIHEKAIYLSGYSMGAIGAWEYAMQYPSQLTGIIPIAGYCISENYAVLANMKVWNFHGVEDEVIPISQSDTLIHNVQKINNTVQYSRMDHIAHNSMLYALEKKELYEWITDLS